MQLTANFKRGGGRAGRLWFVTMKSARYLTGQFLLAMPGIGDPRFARARHRDVRA